MAGLRWPSPPLPINTRGGHHRKGGRGGTKGFFLERR